MHLLSLALIGTIDQKRVHLIDSYPRSQPHNFIFRGNNPTTTASKSTIFDYDGLVAAVKTAAANECSVTLPESFRVVDVDLENLSDPGYLQELQYWKDHPEQGEALKWTQLGTVLDVKAVPRTEPWVRNGSWAIQGDADHLPERLTALHAMLTNTTGPPTVFYVHCNAGCDRTGEFIGAYAMSYLGYNITTAMGEAQRQCGRTPNFFATESLGWWCLTLKDEGRTDVGDCLNAFGCQYLKDCDAHGPTPLAHPCPRAQAW